MRNFILLLVLALIGAGAYGYHTNPKACLKLSNDAVADIAAIYLPDSDTASAGANAAPAAGETPPPKHFQPGFAPAPATVSTPVPAAPQVPVVPRVYASNDFNTYGEALNASRERHRPILMLFTGSDWCPPCQMLEREVISTSEFQDYKNSHFVFVIVDDLRNSPVDDDEKVRVQNLEKSFEISAFPTLLVVSSEGHTVGKVVGYASGEGPGEVIRDLNKYANK